ncbi:MAG: tail fiber domain-containing protein [Verrucomicrobiota bacterium]|jgi:hypothetical protein
MNKLFHCAVAGLLLPTLNYSLSIGLAQTTDFTYQGRVSDNGTNFTGNGQFQFALVTSSNANQTATATAEISGGYVTGYIIDNGGNGYVTAPLVTVYGGGGANAGGRANISGGAVTSITVTKPGNGGYTSAPTVTITPPPASISYNTYWSNDGTSVNGSEPSAALSVAVNDGLFTIVLGDTTQPNMAAIPAALFNQPGLQMRIWFNDGANGFAALSPAQTLTPAPYAVYATTAGELIGLSIEPNSDGAPNVIDGSSVNFVSNGVVGATIAGGGATNYLDSGVAFSNSVTADFGTVSGGEQNTASGNNATVSGGVQNTASGASATVSGGSANGASGPIATVSGGVFNIASGPGAFVGGGGFDGASLAGNTASGAASIVAGGWANQATSTYAGVLGGIGNTASGNNAAVSGGQYNTASGFGAFIGGGGSDEYGVVGNTASGLESVVAGGLFNQATNSLATVSGGANNTAGGSCATVSGGSENVVSGSYAAVSGGALNTATGNGAFVGGGGFDGVVLSGNTASGNASAVAGGLGNQATNFYATIAGGSHNTASGSYATVGGGNHNTASGGSSTVSGGSDNDVSGPNATVGGGAFNEASGKYSFAAGQQAQAVHQGAFVWGDSQNAPFASTANDQVSFRCAGGVLFTSGNGSPNQTVSWTPGSASWSFSSDRNLKDRFENVDAASVLDKVAQLPVVEWSYKGYPQRHIGAMAQDFHQFFPLNDNDKVLNDADLHGVELAAIQGLNQKLEEQNADLKRQNDSLAQRLDNLAQVVQALVEKK